LLERGLKAFAIEGPFFISSSKGRFTDS